MMAAFAEGWRNFDQLAPRRAIAHRYSPKKVPDTVTQWLAPELLLWSPFQRNRADPTLPGFERHDTFMALDTDMDTLWSQPSRLFLSPSQGIHHESPFQSADWTAGY